jgi:hypothetical protein
LRRIFSPARRARLRSPERPSWTGFLAFAVTLAGQAHSGAPTGTPASPILVGEDRAVAAGGQDLPLVEPHLSVDPRDGDHWFAAAIAVSRPDLAETDCAALATFDGGKSWIRHDLGLKECADPWTAMLPDGTAVLAVLSGEGLDVYRSPDGGRTWSDPPVRLEEGHDHETLAVDRTSGPRHGSLFVLSVQSAREPSSGQRRNAVFVARSSDGGKTFPERTRVFPSNLGFNTATGAVLSDGTLAVSYSDYQRPSPDGSVWLERGRSWLLLSSDGGKTFSAPMWIADDCGRSFPVLASEDSPAFRDRLYWVCNGRGDGRTATPDFERILVHHSSDRGEKWSDAVRANAGSGSRPYVRTASVAVGRSNAVGVSWYDGRNDKEKFKGIFQCLDFYFTVSRDGGATFLPEARVSSQSGCADSPRNGKARYRWPAGGDYTGIAARPDGGFQLLWSDSRDGVYRLRTSTVRLANTEGN